MGILSQNKVYNTVSPLQSVCDSHRFAQLTWPKVEVIHLFIELVLEFPFPRATAKDRAKLWIRRRNIWLLQQSENILLVIMLLVGILLGECKTTNIKGMTLTGSLLYMLAKSAAALTPSIIVSGGIGKVE